MTTICPKCRNARPAQTSAPSWQCPACGVAYAKAGDTGVSARSSATTVGGGRDEGSWFSGIPWVKLVLVVAVAYGAWVGLHRTQAGAQGAAPASLAGKFGANSSTEPSTEQLTALAASTPSADVLIYSAPWCSNCAAAKGWLAQYGFKYQECDVQASSACLGQLKALDAQGGVPYLIVKGRHMKDGFDSDEFIAALRP